MSISNEAFGLSRICEELAKIDADNKGLVKKYGLIAAGLYLAEQVRRLGYYGASMKPDDPGAIEGLTLKVVEALVNINDSILRLEESLPISDPNQDK